MYYATLYNKRGVVSIGPDDEHRCIGVEMDATDWTAAQHRGQWRVLEDPSPHWWVFESDLPLHEGELCVLYVGET